MSAGVPISCCSFWLGGDDGFIGALLLSSGPDGVGEVVATTSSC